MKNFEVTAPRSRFFQGGFGRLFPDLKPWVPRKPDGTVPASESEMEALVMDIARTKMNAAHDVDADATLPAGYTYFGQFVDHDITLDLTPLSEARADPNRLHNFRRERSLTFTKRMAPGSASARWWTDPMPICRGSRSRRTNSRRR
ncbi:MAG TPA: hypothetical protein VGN60_02955 [Devosia sp.]|nr:hypothetical protein [Devosia sp.]